MPQMTKAYDLAKDRLADLEERRRELDEVIDELKGQLELGRTMIQAAVQTAAAE